MLEDPVIAATEFLRAGIQSRPRVALVLGSGLAGIGTAIQEPSAVPFREIPGFPDVSVDGHGSSLLFGMLETTPVVIQTGRFHLYEGHDPQTVALPVRIFAALGVETLIVTNAAGGIRRDLRPPTIMLIADHVNLMFRNPLMGPVQGKEERFPDMSGPYDPDLRNEAKRSALSAGIQITEGTYAAVTGPSYETPAEIRMLERLGADAVGMSTVPEVLAARASGLKVLGISTITNLAAGLSPATLSHDDVLEAGRETRDDVEILIRGVLPTLNPSPRTS